MLTKTVAELIDDLFLTHRRDDGKEYTHTEVCVALKGAIEPGHLSKLRNGVIKNPSRETLLALCTFFQVEPTYFFPELEPSKQSVKGEDPIAVALGSSQLSPAVRRKLLELIQLLNDDQERYPQSSEGNRF